MSFNQLDLRNGEILLMSGAANKWQAYGSKGGMLFLTNQRIVFKAHAFNFGSKVDEYELSDIQTQNNTVNIKTSSNFNISFNITFSTKSGEELSFVVTRKQKDEWIRQIIHAVASCTKISMPENISEVEKTQIKVVQCEGCGAFVIVASGNTARCDYCGRPAAYTE